MLKRLTEKYGVVNRDISDAEVFDVLSGHFPHVKFANKSSSRTVQIVARHGIAKLTIGRTSRGSFQFKPEISGIYHLLTLGLIGLFEGMAGREQFREITDFMRERFHRPGEF